jgi:hypothetical protein
MTPYGQRAVALAAVILLMFSMAGCQTIAQPETGSRGVATAYVAIESLSDLAMSLHSAGAISDAEWAEARQKLRQAFQITNAAETALADGDSAEPALMRINALLREVQAITQESSP